MWCVCDAFGLKKPSDVGELDPEGREWQLFISETVPEKVIVISESLGM